MRETLKKRNFIKKQKNQPRTGTKLSENRIILHYFAPGRQERSQSRPGHITKHTCIMEQLNRIELRGNVGNVRVSDVGGNRVARFSLATNFLYKGKDSEAVVETTWHNIVAWGGKGMPDFSAIVKGAPVYVTGRLRTSRFIGNDGTEKTVYEVVASKVEIIGLA